MNQETKVGVFLLMAFGAILTSILFLGNVRLFKRSLTYYVTFKDVEALPPKAAVKVAGVEIGKVSKVALVDGAARVTISINTDVPVYADALARVGSTGIIGTRYIELVPGLQTGSPLPSGSTIKGESAASLNQMISKISGLFEEDPQYGSAVDNLKATLANIRQVSDTLAAALGNHPKDIESIVQNIKELTENAKVFTAHLREISTEKKDDVKIALTKFKEIGEKLDDILGKIHRGEGTIGALVSDEKTANDVKEAVASIKDTAAGAKKVIGRFTMINTYWNYRYRYDFKDEEGKSDLGITFVPRPGKYYAIGVTNLGEPIANEKHLVYERKNRITAVMGADFGPFTGFAGAIRSDAGVGLNFRPLWKNPKWGRRLELTSEAADFNRDRVVNGEKLNKAWVSVGAHVAVQKWLWLGVRAEDVLERAAVMAYTNVIFRDEDLAYLLGFASFAK